MTSWDIFIEEIDPKVIISAVEAERAINYFQPNLIVLISSAQGIKNTQKEILSLQKKFRLSIANYFRKG